MKKVPTFIGMDEAGRGPWAGPVVAACVVLPKKFDTKLLKDSKKLTPAQREKVYPLILEQCQYGIGIVGNTEIDQMGIKKATELAMNHALYVLIRSMVVNKENKSKKKKSSTFDHFKLLVDGNDKFSFPVPHESIIKGDEKIPAISAASILAKVWRDKLMDLYHDVYPRYSFQEHKGYGTAKHQAALEKYGICFIHRVSYKPVAKIRAKKPND